MNLQSSEIAFGQGLVELPVLKTVLKKLFSEPGVLKKLFSAPGVLQALDRTRFSEAHASACEPPLLCI
jgi:hypothetical protein